MYLIKFEADGFVSSICAKGKVKTTKVIDRIIQTFVDESIIYLDDVFKHTIDTPNLQNTQVSDFKSILEKGFDFTIWFKNGDKYFVMVEINRIEVLK